MDFKAALNGLPDQDLTVKAIYQDPATLQPLALFIDLSLSNPRLIRVATMISQTISDRNENPLISAFWIPLLALPIISFLTNHNEIPRGVIPQTFYQHQLDYFDHRNAVITYWDMVASNTNNEDLLLEYLSEHKSNKTIEVNLLDNHVLP